MKKLEGARDAQHMNIKEHQHLVVQEFKEHFLENVEALTGVELSVESESIETEKQFIYKNKLSAFMDLNGSIIGYVGIICEERSAGALLEMAEEDICEETREDYGPLMAELLNVVGGALVPTITKEHPLVTMTSPRLSYGHIEFPQSESTSMCLQTQLGAFELYYATDTMGLKVIELLEKVKAQKANIELILEHVPTPLLTFDLGGSIGAESSKSARDIFGEELAQKKIEDVIVQDPRKIKEINAVLRMLPHSPLSFEENMVLAPSGDKLNLEGKLRQLKYHYAPMYALDDEQKLEKIMVLAEDITEEMKLKEEAQAREEKAEFIHKVLKNRDGYINFLDESNAALNAIMEYAKHKDEDHMLAAFRASHTIKGNSAIFGIRSVRNAAHELEDALIELRDHHEDPKHEDLKTVEALSKTLEEVFQQHIQETEQMFGDDFDPKKNVEKKYTIQESKLDSLIHMTDKPALLSELEKIKLKKVYIYISPYEDLVYNLAQKLSKDIQPLELRGENTLIHPDRWKSFFASFVHLIRNCVDHGIETPEERLAQNKPKMAKISIDVIEKESGIVIVVKDDGRGICPEHVAKSARQKGIASIQELEAMSDKEKQMLIFKPGFSTQEKVTSISGRGIGMEAVQYEVQALKGFIDVESEVGQGTSFIISIPYLHDEAPLHHLHGKNARAFQRFNVPLYLPIFLDNGCLAGHVVDLSPDGLRVVSELEYPEHSTLSVQMQLESPTSAEEQSIWFKLEIMNSRLNQPAKYEWGCRIISFANTYDQLKYERYLRIIS